MWLYHLLNQTKLKVTLTQILAITLKSYYFRLRCEAKERFHPVCIGNFRKLENSHKVPSSIILKSTNNTNKHKNRTK